MPDLKLARLPDRTPVKIAVSVSPELNQALRQYAEIYRATYGESETVAELIPFMLSAFLDSDRGFTKARKECSVERLQEPVRSRRVNQILPGPSSATSQRE